MIRMTLDTNCIIDLEEQRPDSKYLVEIIDAWRNGKVNLAVVAVSASENQPGGQVNETYKQFQEKLASVGLAGVTELLPLAYWDVFYWDHALWSSEETGSSKMTPPVPFPILTSARNEPTATARCSPSLSMSVGFLV